MEFISLYNRYQQKQLSGRYVHNKHLFAQLEHLSDRFNIVHLGLSVQKQDIIGLEFGKGKTKILMWSQMHGNESTTTKALFDFIDFLDSNEDFARNVEENFTLLIIPILNPDGAKAYTRVNANNIDLNRDSVDLSQPESQILRTQIDTFKPDFCLNLHDQRTIFGTKGFNKPATVSFLAPSYNEERDINNVREIAMQLIACMNEDLQKFIPNQIGRFDDGFNLNCIGDMCTNLGIPTILFEAGHYENDYEREQTRKYIFYSYLSFFNALLTKNYVNKEISDYLTIPENTKSFFDIIYKNFQLNVGNIKKSINFAVQYEEFLNANDIIFVAKISKIDNLENFLSHKEFDLQNENLFDFQLDNFEVGNLANFVISDKYEIVNGLLINRE